MIVCTVLSITIGAVLFAETVTFDTGDVVAILAILTLIGLVFIAGLAGFAYVIVTFTRSAKHRASVDGEGGQPGRSSPGRDTRLASTLICSAAVVVGVAVAGVSVASIRAFALPAAFAAAGGTAFVLTALTSGNGHR